MTNNQKFKNERNTVTTKTVLQYSINRIFNRLNKENYNQKNNIELFCKTVDCPEIEIINDAIKSLPEYSIVPSVYESEKETERYLKQLKEQLLNSMSFKIEFKKFDTNEKEIKVNTTTFKGVLNRVYLEILNDKNSLESHEYEIYKGEPKEPYAIIQSLSPFKLIVNSTGQCNSTDVAFTQEHEFNKFDDLLEKLDSLIKENQNSSTYKLNNIRILNSSLKLHDDYTAEDLMNKTFIEDLNVNIHNLALDTTLFYEKQLEDEICKPITVDELFSLGNTEIIKNERQEEKQHNKFHL